MKVWILIFEAFAVYGLVLGSHALRRKVGLSFFYALIGSMTAIMSWVTDAGAVVHLGGITFLVGSTVFYTALLLGVFVVYAFDGPQATRIAILTVVGVSALVPLIALILHLQLHLATGASISSVPVPSLRINLSSVTATLLDLLFLAISWEWLHKRQEKLPLGARAFLTLLGVMWLDVVLFNTLAFAGTPEYLSIMFGTFVSRLVVAVFASPVLWAYLVWQNSIQGVEMPHRPLLAILKQLSEVKQELDVAREEIRRRKLAEEALRGSEKRYRQLVENAGEAILVVKNGLFVLYNQKALDVTGLSDLDMRTKSYLDVVPKEYQEPAQRAFERAMQADSAQADFEFGLVRPGRGEVWLQANVVCIEWEGLPSALVFLRDITERRRKEHELMALAITDPLTGASNRRHFMDSLERESERCQRYGSAFALIYLDVDHFKRVNDKFGHAAGDAVLKRIVEIAHSLVRDVDLLARLGGEEFAVLLPETGLGMAAKVAERLRICVENEVFSGLPEGLRLTISLGVAEGLAGLSADELLDTADRALLKAKELGRNRVMTVDGAPQL